MTLLWQQRIMILAALLVLAGCIPRIGTWSQSADGLPVLKPALPSPQTAGTSIPWRVSVPGATADQVYEFIVADGENEVVMYKSKGAEWQWQPQKAGTYRVKAMSTDALGNTAQSSWSAPYEVVPQLHIEALRADTSAPQVAGMTMVGWLATARGGVGDLNYTFILSDGSAENVTQRGSSSLWRWQPTKAGMYRVMVVVKDSRGNSVQSSWSAPFEVAAELQVETLQVDKPSPQAARMTTINWQALASGGVGELSYEFILSHGSAENVTQSGPSSAWQWVPHQEGSYRTKVVVKDSLGNSVQSDWSKPYEVVPELQTEALRLDKPAPQAAGMTAINWQAIAHGGVGTLNYEFVLSDGRAESVAQSGPSPLWQWQPKKAGIYRVKAIIADALGNNKQSGWSDPYEVVPELLVVSLQADKPAPQAAMMAEINWQATAGGGLGELSYDFFLSDGSAESVVQSGPSPAWQWQPKQAGTYRIKTIVTDSLGNTRQSSSEPYEVAPELQMQTLKVDKPAPQAANMTTIGWQATASGGAGKLTYEFTFMDDEIKTIVRNSTSSLCRWQPHKPGKYRAKVVVQDIRGNTVQSDWSEPYEVVPELLVTSLIVDKPAPQAAMMAEINWQTTASGGVGKHTYEFVVTDGEEEIVARRKDMHPSWQWQPKKSGLYRIKAVVSDSLGNTAMSEWSAPYAVAPELKMEALQADKQAPQAARMATVNWQAIASGGAGALAYTFTLSDGQEETAVQSSTSALWQWLPQNEGTYRIKVVAQDIRGNSVQSDWSAPYEVVPELVVEILRPDKPSPQAARMTEVNWQSTASGGVGDLTYVFIVSDGKQEIAAQNGTKQDWRWRPEAAGFYLIKTMVTDALGNQAASHWSDPFEVLPELEVEGLRAAKPPPQKAGIGPIAWHAVVKGGVPPLAYEFSSRYNGKELIEQQGESPFWQWLPLEKGQYLISVKVTDAMGNIVKDGQSVAYEILAPLGPESLIAVLPLQNLSGAKAPLKKIQEHLESMVRQKGMRLVDEQLLGDFIKRHRLRYTAGIDSRLTLALQQETGADAVLFSTLELYSERGVPKISLTAWLDMCSAQPRIIWMNSKSLSGDETPGLLDLGMIRNPDQLLDKVLTDLFKSWEPLLLPSPSRQLPRQVDGAGKFRPQEYFRSESFSPRRRYTVAIMPFYNLSERKYAGELMELHFVRQLRKVANLTVIEPGELRQFLLRYRIIMEDGLYLAHAEVLFAKLGVDLLVTGKIFDYEDYGGMIGRPIVDFSVEVFSRQGNQTVWTSKSYTDGANGVFFFDLGKVYTAHNLAGQMVGTIAGMLEQ
ncbi:MAG: hypothetical protein KKG53_11090 [Proteobacteria bacterium]|nr:hypothetical protein [Pseudomonadota bacterium]